MDSVFSRALIGYSIREYPALFIDLPPVPLPVCCRNKQRNFTTNQASCSRNT